MCGQFYLSDLFCLRAAIRSSVSFWKYGCSQINFVIEITDMSYQFLQVSLRPRTFANTVSDGSAVMLGMHCGAAGDRYGNM